MSSWIWKSTQAIGSAHGCPNLCPSCTCLRQWRLDAANKVLSEATDANIQEAEAFAARIRAFQFRDIRPKAASDIQDLSAASALLGHTEQEITRKVYIRKGPDVNPTR